MYVRPEDLNFDIMYQGDVLKDFPFFIFQEDLRGLKQSEKKGFYEVKEKETFEDNEAILAVNSKLNHVIILSQTCDLQERENVIIAPIYSIREFEDNGVLTGGKSGLIKKRKINYWFYLPEVEGLLGSSFADFQTMHYVPKKMLENYKKNKILTLSDWGRHHLGWALSNYFGRPIEDKNS
jgi:hypothetical protein